MKRVKRPRTVLVELTRAQALALASLAEMTEERALCDFAAWGRANPQSMRAVRAALDKLEWALAWEEP